MNMNESSFHFQFAEWCFDYGKHGCRTPDTPYSLFEGNNAIVQFQIPHVSNETRIGVVGISESSETMFVLRLLSYLNHSDTVNCFWHVCNQLRPKKELLWSFQLFLFQDRPLKNAPLYCWLTSLFHFHSQGMAGTVYFLVDLLEPRSARFPAFDVWNCVFSACFTFCILSRLDEIVSYHWQ